MGKFLMIILPTIVPLIVITVSTTVSLQVGLFTETQSAVEELEEQRRKEENPSLQKVPIGGQDSTSSIDIEFDSTVSVQSFNSQFRSYEGSGRSASEINVLIKRVADNNEVSDKKIGIYGSEEIKFDEAYTVKFEYDYEGYISTILVTKDITE